MDEERMRTDADRRTSLVFMDRSFYHVGLKDSRESDKSLGAVAVVSQLFGI
jgi:hypothetical protein